MERNKKVEFLLIALLVLQAAAYAWLYPSLPDKIPPHWVVNGHIDGGDGIAFILSLSLGLYLLLWAVPLLDPKKKISANQKAYNTIRLAVQFLLFLEFACRMAMAMGIPLSVDRIITAAASVVFIIMGNYMGKIRPNYFIGIRNPWTLEDPVVWQKTHRLGGPVIILIGLIGLMACLLIKNNSFHFFLIVPIITGGVFLMGYSWFQFRRLHPKPTDG